MWGLKLVFDYCKVAAYHTDHKSPRLLSDNLGRTSIPTWIACKTMNILIGHDAKIQAAKNVENTFYDFALLLRAWFSSERT